MLDVAAALDLSLTVVTTIQIRYSFARKKKTELKQSKIINISRKIEKIKLLKWNHKERNSADTQPKLKI